MLGLRVWFRGWLAHLRFGEFLAKRLPDSRRKAYYLMAIHEKLDKNCKAGTSRGRLEERDGIGQSDEERWGRIQLCDLVAQKQKELPTEGFKGEVERKQECDAQNN